MPKTPGSAAPNIPWEERPPGCRDVVWRYSRNPIIPSDLLPNSNSIFKSESAMLSRPSDRGYTPFGDIFYRELYGRAGDTLNVVFPCAALVDVPTNRLAIYYGAADTVTGLAFARVDQVVDFAKRNSNV